MNSTAPIRMSAASGMLIPNAQRHEACSASQPPSNGPRADAAPMVEPQTAKAWPRAFPGEHRVQKRQ